ncbi:MAG: HAD-IC family P-type ATPase [Acholeplasma sp.]|nr:HAD-IC family P-type ATPase [Acholeplasma sp.]
MAKEVVKEIDKQKEKKKRGPKTVIVEEPVKFKGDPFNLDDKAEVYPDLDVKANIKSRDEIVVERYNPDIDKGLTINEVETRIMAGAVNEMAQGSSKKIVWILFTNIFTFFNIMTFGIAIWMITAEIYSIMELNFLLIAFANLIIGIIQEVKAKKTIDKLSLLSAPTAIVVRDKTQVEISINTIVIDDILKLSSGKQISADAVVRSGTLEVDESLLTGESDIIVKKEGDPLYSGSFVISGTAYAQVVAVGKDIYVQKLTNQAKKYQKPKSELFNSLKWIIRSVGVLIIPIGITLFYLMSKMGLEYQEIVVRTSGAVIGMIPSGLFLLTSSALAVGVIRLAQNNALVQELFCIEMLARVDVLCLDKTGTITDGTMSVHSVIEYKNPTGLTLKNIISAMLNSQEDRNLTSKALEERFGTGKRIRSVAEIPFSSARKFSAVSFDKYGTFLLGAPEFVVKRTVSTQDFFNEVDKQSKNGYRVLVVAHSKELIEEDKVVGNVVPLGLIMIEDSIRPDAIETIGYFKSSGVAVRVISGDNPITVSRIAQRAGVADAHKYISLEGLTNNEVINAANEYIVFGRVSPNQKKILVEALKAKGHTVAMTGDGVNDILALREADTSIALASGSEAARNVAHLVLLDSNFSSMPKVVVEGRRVINNIQKLSGLFLAKTLFTLLLAISAIISKGEYPITTSQLTPINLLIIGIPTFFLAMESNNSRVEGKFFKNVIKGALPGAVVVLINSLIIFWLSGLLGMDYEVKSTLIVLSATMAMFILLLKLSWPLNRFRFMIVASMFMIFLVVTLARPDYFKLVPFSTTSLVEHAPLTPAQILLLIALIQGTYPLLYIASNFIGWMKIIFNKSMKAITGVR